MYHAIECSVFLLFFKNNFEINFSEFSPKENLSKETFEECVMSYENEPRKRGSSSRREGQEQASKVIIANGPGVFFSSKIYSIHLA